VALFWATLSNVLLLLRIRIQHHCNVLCALMTDTRWNKRQLTYRFLNYSPDLPSNTTRSVFQQAFKVMSLYDTIRYDTVYLTCSKKLTCSQLSLPHRHTNKFKQKSELKIHSFNCMLAFY